MNLPPEIEREWLALRAAHEAAQREMTGADISGSPDWDFHYENTQRKWDALIDFVEANDLNYTPFDPRED